MLAARDWRRRRIYVEGRLDEVADKLVSDYNSALIKKTVSPLK